MPTAYQIAHVNRLVEIAVTPALGDLLLVNGGVFAVDAGRQDEPLAATRGNRAGLAVHPAHLLQADEIVFLFPRHERGIHVAAGHNLKNGVVFFEYRQKVALNLAQL